MTRKHIRSWLTTFLAGASLSILQAAAADLRPLYDEDPNAMPTPHPNTQQAATTKYKNYHCAPMAGPGTNTSANKENRHYAKMFAGSPTASALWRTVAHGPTPHWTCIFKNTTNPNSDAVTLDNENYIFLVNTREKHVSREIFLLRAMHGLHLMSHDGIPEPKNTIELLDMSLAVYATIAASSAQMAWEIAASGRKEFWEKDKAEGYKPCALPSRHDCPASIYEAFENAVKNNPENARNGAAMRAAFREAYNDLVLVHSIKTSVDGDKVAPLPPLDQLPKRGRFNTFPVPSPALSAHLDVLGEIPGSNVNFLRDAGGMRAVLQTKNAQDAALLKAPTPR